MKSSDVKPGVIYEDPRAKPVFIWLVVEVLDRGSNWVEYTEVGLGDFKTGVLVHELADDELLDGFNMLVEGV